MGNIILQSIVPNFTNEMAIAQMTNSWDSTAGASAVSYLHNCYGILSGIFALVMFRQEIKFFIFKLKERITNEEI